MRKKIILIVCLAFVTTLNIYFRTFPINFPQLKIQAKAIVEQRILQGASQEIDKKFPAFSPLAKKNLINAFISDYKRQEKQEIKKQIHKEYVKLKDRFQDPQGQTYLMELDCWHWARYVENVLRLGHPGDRIVDKKQFDSLMFAPSGGFLPWNTFLFYLSAFLYKLFSLFKPIPLFPFLFYLPLFFIAILMAVLYLFSFRGSGNLGAIIACLFVGLSPIFLMRSHAGWFDMDILELILPLLVVWAYLKAFETPSFKLRFLWVCLSSFWVGLFCFTWIGWWFIFLIIIIYEIYSLANLLFVRLQYKEKISALFKQRIFSFLSFICLTFFWIIIFSGFQPLVDLYSRVKGALILNKSLTFSLWPNVYSTVGELEKMSVRQITNVTGGVFIFIFSLICMLILFLRTRHNQRYAGFKSEATIILVIWFFSMFLACFKGIRFIMFLTIPLGIFLGWSINDAYEYFKNKKKEWGACLLIIITIVLSDVFIGRAYNTAGGIFPFMNDAWYKTLNNLKEKTPKEAIINSWWDFGDWFKAVSGRRVIFDGQSQNLPQAYWMAKVLISQNEEEAVRILRMLNNGGNKAFEIIDGELKDPLKSVLLLKRIILAESKDAKQTLSQFLPVSMAEEAIKLLFDKPDKAYFIVEYTMQGKISPISYLGNWDFLKAYLTRKANRGGKGEIVDYFVKLDIDSQEAQKLSQEALLISGADSDSWVSQRLRFYSPLVNGQEKNGTVFFDNGLVYNPKEQTVYLYSPPHGRYVAPKSLFIFQQDKLEEIIFPKNDLEFSVLVIRNPQGYKAILLDRELANSLFVRLYFLNGAGLKYFKPVMEEKDGEAYIRVFEIMWD